MPVPRPPSVRNELESWTLQADPLGARTLSLLEVPCLDPSRFANAEGCTARGSLEPALNGTPTTLLQSVAPPRDAWSECAAEGTGKRGAVGICFFV